MRNGRVPKQENAYVMYEVTDYPIKKIPVKNLFTGKFFPEWKNVTSHMIMISELQSTAFQQY